MMIEAILYYYIPHSKKCIYLNGLLVSSQQITSFKPFPSTQDDTQKMLKKT